MEAVVAAAAAAAGAEVAVAVAVAVAEVAVAVAEVAEAVVPLSRYTWSGPDCPKKHAMRRAHVVQPVPKPSPGFCQAAAALASSRPVPPVPLAARLVRLVRLDGDPVHARAEDDRRGEIDDEARPVGEGLVRASLEQRPGQVAAAVRIEVDVDRCRRPGAVEVLALDVDARRSSTFPRSEPRSRRPAHRRTGSRLLEVLRDRDDSPKLSYWS